MQVETLKTLNSLLRMDKTVTAEHRNKILSAARVEGAGADQWRWVTSRDVCKLFAISRSTLNYWLRTDEDWRKLTVSKQKGALRFRSDEIERLKEQDEGTYDDREKRSLRMQQAV